MALRLRYRFIGGVSLMAVGKGRVLCGFAFALLGLSSIVALHTPRAFGWPLIARSHENCALAQLQTCTALSSDRSAKADVVLLDARGRSDSHRWHLIVNDDTSATKDSAYVPSGYVKVLSDEFGQSRLDTARWWTRYIYADGTLDFLNDEQQRYRENGNHVMTGHSLILMAKKVGGDGDQAGYESGMIRSKRTFRYGYFEARLKVPGGLGVRSAFWLNSARRPSDGKISWPPEIDILELANNGAEDTPDMLHTSVAYHSAQQGKLIFSEPNFNTDWNYWRAPYKLSEDFHVYAALWDTDDTVSTYLDGRLICKVRYKWVYDDGTPAGYAHVLLDLAIGGPNWAGRHGIDNTAFPQGIEVQYVRVYQKIDRQATGRDTIGHDLCPVEAQC
jgi:beta-glucanase (GH16 family)